jgi:hypothetical protein
VRIAGVPEGEEADSGVDRGGRATGGAAPVGLRTVEPLQEASTHWSGKAKMEGKS